MEHIKTVDELKQRTIYCLYCADYIDGSEIKPVANDAEQLEFPCPGCGWALVWPVDRLKFYGLDEDVQQK